MFKVGIPETPWLPGKAYFHSSVTRSGGRQNNARRTLFAVSTEYFNVLGLHPIDLMHPDFLRGKKIKKESQRKMPQSQGSVGCNRPFLKFRGDALSPFRPLHTQCFYQDFERLASSSPRTGYIT
jgi:hypothetical protein